MTREELAALLNGGEYGAEVDKDICATAKANGLVIVFGASDDLMEFEGALSEEISAYGGTIALVDAKGVLPEWDDIKDKDRRDYDFMRDYFQRQGSVKAIEACWDSEGYTWTYKTDIPHATFEIVEDGDKYCRGIVLSLKDIQP